MIKVRLGSYIVQKAEKGTAGDLFYWKYWKKIWQDIYFIEKTKIRADWIFFNWKG